MMLKRVAGREQYNWARRTEIIGTEQIREVFHRGDAIIALFTELSHELLLESKR